jgi:DNA-binding CsgD family transcriptional regulator
MPRPLTPREADVLRYTADGRSAYRIATVLGVPELEVRSTLKRAIRALGARTVDQAIQIHNQQPGPAE